jgi:bacteriorhodopsin
MLITLLAYLSDQNKSTLKEYISKNKLFISKIIILNMSMMLFGLAGELNYINYNTSIMIGFIPFVCYFKLIYDKYLSNNTDKDKLKLYFFFFILWTLYGVVAFLPYEQKNIAYNIIDLFSKNLFSVFLVIVILNLKKNSIQTPNSL